MLIRRKKARGKELEQHIEKMLKQLQSLRQLVFVRLKVERGREREPGDFLVKTRTETWLIDTKETGYRKFYFTKATIAHQVKAMHDWRRLGCRAGFLIWFTDLDPLKKNLRFVEDLDEPATIESGIRFGPEAFL